MIQEKKPLGEINISNEAIATIAGAAAYVKGVVGMSSGIVDGIAKLLVGKEYTKGIKVELKDEKIKINVYLIVEYGVSIPEVAWQVQENVKTNVEAMTGLSVDAVNVYIHGIHIEKERK